MCSHMHLANHKLRRLLDEQGGPSRAHTVLHIYTNVKCSPYTVTDRTSSCSCCSRARTDVHWLASGAHLLGQLRGGRGGGERRRTEQRVRERVGGRAREDSVANSLAAGTRTSTWNSVGQRIGLEVVRVVGQLLATDPLDAELRVRASCSAAHTGAYWHGYTVVSRPGA